MTLLLVGYVALIFLAVVLFFKFRILKKPSRESQIVSAPEQSLKDPITDLYNKKHLLARLSEYMARAQRDKKLFAVVLWDVNGFVKFNNEYGQKHGDRLLQNVAAHIKRCLRTYDEAFRSGPDEFCAILAPADISMAEVVSSRVNQSVSQELFEGRPEYAGHGFSLLSGFVIYPDENETPEALLHAAAQSLYKSKMMAGRTE